MIKTNKLRVLGFATLLAAAAATMGTANAQNAGFAQYQDLALFFQKPEASGNNAIVNVALPLLTDMRNQRGTNAYDILLAAGALNTALSSNATFGSGWASDTQLYAGAGSNRGVSSNINAQFQTSGDANRTLYYTQARATNGSAGLQNSAPSPMPGINVTQQNTSLANAQTSIDQAGARFETAGTGNIWEDTRASSFVDNNMPIGGVQFSNQSNVGNFMSGAPFTFGGQTNVVLVLDLFRTQVSGTFSNTSASPGPGGLLAGETTLTPLFLGNIVLKNTGEVGFLTIPEPTTATMLALAI